MCDLSWAEIRVIHRWLPPTSEGWHRHCAGGGWVEDSASVEQFCYVGPKALVHQEAQVRGVVGLFDQSRIFGKAKVKGYVRLLDDSKICGEASVWGGVCVRNNAIILGRAKVRGHVQVLNMSMVTGKAILGGTEVVYDCMFVDR